MNSTMRLALAAVAVVAVALAGFTLYQTQNVGGPRLDDSTPSPTPSPLALLIGELEAGTYTTQPAGARFEFTFTVPSGWRAFDDKSLLPAGDGSSEAPDGMAIGFNKVDRMYSDPCHGTAVTDIEVGPTVDDLVTALSDHTAWETSTPEDVTLGAYSGKRVDLQLPADVASCDNGEFYVFAGGPYAQGPNNRWHLWILDVEGTRAVILGVDFAGTSAEDQAEMLAIIESVVVNPAP